MSKTKKPQINFKYQKSANYQTCRIDGLFGGVLPNTRIWADVFIEKGIVPEAVIYDVDDKGSLVETKRTPDDKTNYIIRELQAGFVLDLPTAKIVRDWLSGRIQEVETELARIKQK